MRLKIELAGRETAGQLLQSSVGPSEMVGVLILCAFQINQAEKCVSGLWSLS